MTKKFPDWAPPSIIKWYETSSEYQNDKVNRLRERLLSHPNMESVWKTLRKRSENEYTDGSTNFILFLYLVGRFKYAADRNKPSWEKLTTTKRKKLKLKIQGLIDELDECIDLVPGVMLEQMVDFLPLPEDVVLDLALRQDPHIKNMFGRDGYRNDLTKEMIKVYGFGRKIIKDSLKSLKIISKNIDPEFGLLKRPGKVNSIQLYFIRKLGLYLKRTYGTFLYEVIANTASVLYENSNIDKDVVRHAIKGIDMNKVNKYKHYL